MMSEALAIPMATDHLPFLPGWQVERTALSGTDKDPRAAPVRTRVTSDTRDAFPLDIFIRNLKWRWTRRPRVRLRTTARRFRFFAANR